MPVRTAVGWTGNPLIPRPYSRWLDGGPADTPSVQSLVGRGIPGGRLPAEFGLDGSGGGLAHDLLAIHVWVRITPVVR